MLPFRDGLSSGIASFCREHFRYRTEDIPGLLVSAIAFRTVTYRQAGGYIARREIAEPAAATLALLKLRRRQNG
jgi:hypothetical protein